MMLTNHKNNGEPKLIFRLATVTDANLLIDIDTLASQDPRRYAQIGEWCEAGVCHVAEIEGMVVAYAVLHYHFYDSGFIEILMVGNLMRRKEVGLKFIEYFKSICMRPKLFTSTNSSNLPMIKLLSKAGFIESGRIDNLDEQDPEVVFFLPVKNQPGNRVNRLI